MRIQVDVQFIEGWEIEPLDLFPDPKTGLGGTPEADHVHFHCEKRLGPGRLESSGERHYRYTPDVIRPREMTWYDRAAIDPFLPRWRREEAELEGAVPA